MTGPPLTRNCTASAKEWVMHLSLERRAALQGYYSLPTGRVSTRGTAQCRGAPLRVGVAGVQVGALAEGGGRLGAATGGP